MGKIIIYVYDMPEVVSNVAKVLLADNTKVYLQIKSSLEYENLQQDFNNLTAWSQKWLLSFDGSNVTF